MRFGIRAKFALFFWLMALVIISGIGFQISALVEKNTMEQYDVMMQQVLTVTQEAIQLTPDEIRYYGNEGITDKRYFEIAEQVHTIQEETIVTYLYVIYQTSESSAIYLFDGESSGEEVAMGTPAPDYTGEAFDTTREMFSSNRDVPAFEVTTSEFGYLASSLFPLKDEQGNTIALFCADVEMNQVIQNIRAERTKIILGAFFIVAASVGVLMAVVQLTIVKPIREISHGVERIGNGELGLTVAISNHDELGDIAETVNLMSQNVKRTVHQVKDLNETYRRFVPDELFHMLGYMSIDKVQLGDNTNKRMTVMSMQLADIDSLRRQLESKELYHLINRMLSVSVPDVVRCGGVIERFQNGGIQAFYQQNPELAIESAVNVCCHMNQMGDKKLHITFGLSYGAVMVGVVGGEKRMDQVTFSEQRVLADYLQENAQNYSASILVTGSLMEMLSDVQKYRNRFLGYVYLSSQNRVEKVYDIFEGDTDEGKSIKTATKTNFERGVRLYSTGAYREARNHFVEVLKQSRWDKAARAYLDLCAKHPVDETSQNIQCFETL